MDGFQTVGFIILIVLMCILLLIAIAGAFVVYKILSNIRRVTQRVDETSENMGDMVKYMGKKIGPAAASAVGSIIVRRAKSKIKRK